jgi:hypothetical protein
VFVRIISTLLRRTQRDNVTQDKLLLLSLFHVETTNIYTQISHRVTFTSHNGPCQDNLALKADDKKIHERSERYLISGGWQEKVTLLQDTKASSACPLHQ